VSTLLHAACMQISLSSIGFNFQLRVDFGFNVCFPHDVLVLHHYAMVTSWFSLTMHESSAGKTRSPRVLPGENVLLQSPRAQENAL
jgi:hypothetical protein